MSKYISTYQVRRYTCRHKNHNEYVNITMVCQYEYEHTKYASLYISIPSMSKYISTYQVRQHKNQHNEYVNIPMICQYEYEHTKYVSICISVTSMS